MIDKRIKLEVLHDDNGVFVDHSNSAADYLRDTFSVSMVAAEDYLYVGFYKPVSSVFAQMNTPNTTGSVVTVEAWDGAAWAEVDSQDESLGFSRSGFISWDRSDLTSSAVNGSTQYWVRMKVDIDTDALVFAGLNLILSDDQMLTREFPSILDPRLLTNGQTSHIIPHVASRNEIVQTLRNEGYIKYDSNSERESITQWDLLDIFEIREAATYKALSKIFFVLSDDVEDQWWSRHLHFEKLYLKAFAAGKLSIDTNDNGEDESSEKLVPRVTRTWSR